MPRALPASLRTLLDTGLSLARRTPSGRVAFARLRDVVNPDAVHEDIRDRVRAELDADYAAAAVPIDARRIEKALKDAWGRPPAKALDSFDAGDPLAVRPGSQVHGGDLDGSAVAVKVLRPGLAATVRSDLAVLDALAPALGAVFGALDVAGVLQEVREATMDELDLEHEGTTQRQVARVLRGVAGVTVPAVHSELLADGVLVSDLVSGPTLLEEHPRDAQAVAGALVAAHVTALRAGWVLTDPRPGHVVLRPGGEIALLGAGVARRIDPARGAAVLDAVAAFRAGDEDAFARILHKRLGILDEATARRALALGREILGEFASGPARLDGAGAIAAAERALAGLRDGLAIAAVATPDPGDLALARMAGQLASLLTRLGAELDWLEVATEAG